MNAVKHTISRCQQITRNFSATNLVRAKHDMAAFKEKQRLMQILDHLTWNDPLNYLRENNLNGAVEQEIDFLKQKKVFLQSDIQKTTKKADGLADEIDDGVPVHLKKGASDRVIFAFVCVGMGVLAIMSGSTLYKIVVPPPNN